MTCSVTCFCSHILVVVCVPSKVAKGSETTSKEVYQRFHDDVPADESRFIVYDFRYVANGEIDHHKFLLILW